jgi:hypothetical protein
MDTRTVAAIIIGLVVLGVVVIGISMLAYSRRRTERLRRQFGPEYDRLLAEKRSRRRAEAELETRLQRVNALHIREIDPAKRMQLEASWQATQARFADDPPGAVAAAERLVEEALEARGYSVRDLDQCLADLSVHHAQAAGDYRLARDISSRAEQGHATTEDLRKAIISYRALFEDVLGERVRPESHHERAA